MASAAFLRHVAVLADLSEELLEQLAAKATEVRMRAGEWLLREGEKAESLYVIRSGRLEVIAEGPPETLIRVMRRGQVFGELALLQQGRRSASVRACRDSDLLEVGREQFESLIREQPSFAVGLTRAMGAQLAASRTPILAATLPRTMPELDGIGMMDWRQLDRARTAGRAAAREALEQARPSPFFQALA